MTLTRRHALIASAGAASAAALGSAAAQPQSRPLRIGVLNEMAGLYADITGRSSLIAVPMARHTRNNRPGGNNFLRMDGQTEILTGKATRAAATLSRS